MMRRPFIALACLGLAAAASVAPASDKNQPSDTERLEEPARPADEITERATATLRRLTDRAGDAALDPDTGYPNPEIVQAAEDAGVFELLSRLHALETAPAPQAERPMGDEFFEWREYGSEQSLRDLVRLLYARMELAVRQGDGEAAAQSFESALALARHYAVGERIGTRTLWYAMTRSSLDLVNRFALDQSLDGPTCAAMIAALKRQMPLADPFAIEAELQDFVTLLSESMGVKGGLTRAEVPGERERARSVSKRFEALRGLAPADRRQAFDRLLLELEAEERGDAVPFSGMIEAFEGFIIAWDLLRVNTAATHTLLLLEMYRQRHGEWPASLADAVAGELDRLPEDPMAPGQPLGYRLLAPEGDSPTRMILYSTGLDATDDGGAPMSDDWRALHREPGKDYIIIQSPTPGE